LYEIVTIGNGRKESLLYLASKSPRRAQLLKQIGVDFSVLAVDIPEQIQLHETAQSYVQRLAGEKAIAGFCEIKNADATVIAADTLIYINHQVLEKPKNKADAIDMLTMLSGNTHSVLTALSIKNKNKSETIFQSSDVTMRNITQQEMDAYWDCGEPRDKAGAYAIQGKAAVFISQLQGSYSGVMGLPLYETANLLKKFDVDVFADGGRD